MVAQNFINDSVNINSRKRLNLVPLKESVKISSPHEDLTPNFGGGKRVARRWYP
jgi:hypothetical protein